MIAWEDIKEALPTIKPIERGFSNATRGIVTLADGRTVFVKLASDDSTRQHIQTEIHTYQWLAQAGYEHMPPLLVASGEGFALPDLSAWDWEHAWSKAKVDAALAALESLASLPDADEHFDSSIYESGSWQDVPDDMAAFAGLADETVLSEVALILADKSRHAEYFAAFDHKPWQGTELVHYDVRADNFAYDSKAGRGCLVDWNWAGLGNAAFDRTSLLVFVEVSGFEVLPLYRELIDYDSLLWLMGFWLERAASVEDPRLQLRRHRLKNALTASRLLAQL